MDIQNGTSVAKLSGQISTDEIIEAVRQQYPRTADLLAQRIKDKTLSIQFEKRPGVISSLDADTIVMVAEPIQSEERARTARLAIIAQEIAIQFGRLPTRTVPKLKGQPSADNRLSA